MNKAKYYKPPKPSTLPQKPIDQEARPEFTTDFSQKNKYKLSEGEMIQRKASLQSKNKQIARQELAERRRKLEMGIIDEDTRPVFETALTSKKIDLNPTLRRYSQNNFRNLSQMIQYQRQRNKSQSKRNNSKDNQRSNEQASQQNEDNFEQEVKKTQKFIKKLQKVKKQENIKKAVDIMMKDDQYQKKSNNFGPTKILNNETLMNKNSSSQDLNASTLSQQQRLSNIQETIKFMQEKLFNPNWKKDKQKTSNYEEKQKTKIIYNSQQQSTNQFLKHQSTNYLASARQNSNPYFCTVEYSKIESLGEDQKQDESVDIEDFASLKLNLQTSPNSNNLYLNNYTLDDEEIQSCEQKQNNHLKSNQLSSRWKTNRSSHKTEQQPEVDFSLTLNDQLQIQSSGFTNNFINTNNNASNYYQELKKTLFEEIEHPKIKQKSFGGTNSSGFGRTSELQQQQEQFEDQCSNDYFFVSKPQKPQISVEPNYKQENTSNNIQSTSKNCPFNKQLEKLKNMVQGAKNNVNKNYTEFSLASNTTKPLGSSFDCSLPSNTTKSGVMGFDYRGSINIKKHIVKQNS